MKVLKYFTTLATVVFLLNVSADAQEYDNLPAVTDKPEGRQAGKKFRDNFVQGRLMVEEQFYDTALSTFLLLNKWDPENANVCYQVGYLYLQSTAEKTKAIPFLEKAAQNISKKYMPDEPDEKNAPPLALFYLAQAYHLDYRFKEAADLFERFKELIPKKQAGIISDVDRRIDACFNGIEFQKNPVKCTIENLGDSVNSPLPDYSPVVSADESTLMFTSRRKGIGGEDNKTTDDKYFEDIWICTKKADGTWSEAQSIGSTINTLYNEATIGLSADGQRLFIYKDDKGDGGIYESTLNGDTWSYPEKIGESTSSNINLPDSWEPSACISADGNTLYFVSNRKGGYGGRDIYRALKLPNGGWSMATNLGPKINTPYDEDAPFIHPDQKTFFFCSNGHKTMGGFDIFSAHKTDTGWTAPENIGYPINTTGDDVFYYLSPDGRRTYFSSVRKGGFGEKDIYMATLARSISDDVTLLKGFITLNGGDSIPTGIKITASDMESGKIIQEARPNARNGSYILIFPPSETSKAYSVNYEAQGFQPMVETITVEPTDAYKEIIKQIDLKPINFESKTLGTISISGTITDKEGKTIAGVAITVKDNVTRKVVSTYYSSASTGLYYFVLQRGQNFNIAYEAQGYLFQSINVNVPKKPEYSEIKQDIVLEPVKAGVKIVLNNIFFDSGKSALRKESNIELDKLVKILKDYSDIKVEVSGHTDSKGKDAANNLLSQQRAQSVAAYLIKKGISKKRVAAKGYGKTQPIAPNTLANGKPDLKGMQMNRRVEFKILD